MEVTLQPHQHTIVLYSNHHPINELLVKEAKGLFLGYLIRMHYPNWDRDI
jgi:hypothetical protein